MYASTYTHIQKHEYTVSLQVHSLFLLDSQCPISNTNQLSSKLMSTSILNSLLSILHTIATLTFSKMEI